MGPEFLQSPLFLSAQLLVGLVVLVLSGTWMVKSASRLAVLLGLSPIVIGLTIVAFGTSMPELLVSLIANLKPGSTGNLAIGNVVGSNITNISLVLGLGAVMATLPIDRVMLKREYPYMLLMSLVLIGFSWDGLVARGESALLILGLVFFMLYSYRSGRNTNAEEVAEEQLGNTSAATSGRILAFSLLILAISIAGLALGAQWLVDGASNLARIVGISELFIGLSVVALGTSLPELVTTLIAIRRGEQAIAVGNLVGSNLFNILAIVGITAAVKPLSAPVSMLTLDYPVMFLTSALPFVVIPFTRFRAGRILGIPLLLLYVLYYITIYLDASHIRPWPW